MRKERVRLEDHAHIAPMYGHLRHVAATHNDAPLVGRLEAGDEPQGRGLAAPRRPKQRKELARADVERYSVERLDGTGKGLAEPLETNRGGARQSRKVERVHWAARHGRAVGLFKAACRCHTRWHTRI